MFVFKHRNPEMQLEKKHTASHMRDIIEAGCEVAMVRDAVAGGVNEEGNGYEAAMVNYRFMANAVWTTEEAVKRMKAAAAA